MKKRILSLLLVLVTLFGVMPASAIIAIADDRVVITTEDMVVGETYQAEWDYSDDVTDFLPQRISEEDGNLEWKGYGEIAEADAYVLMADFPQSLTVELISENDYYFVRVTNEDWPAEYDEYRIVSTMSIIIYANVAEETKIESSLGNFNVSVEGDVPEDAKLNLDIVSADDYDPNVANHVNPVKMCELLGVYDISITYGEDEWQPAEGENVRLSLNAASWGLYRGCIVYIIHVHENTDGTKLYDTIGPVKVKSGRIEFEVDGFSNFYILKGNPSRTFSLNNGTEDHYYVEPGGQIRFGTTATWETQSSVSGVTASGNTITVDNTVPTGSVATFIASWTATGCGGGGETNTYTVNVHVASRQEVAKGAVETMQIGIYIRQPEAGTAEYPSEPGNTNGDYFAVLPGDTQDTYEIGDGKFADSATEYLDPDIGLSPAWMYDPDGDDIGGIVDATGVYSLKAFIVNGKETINWTNVALAIANYNADKSDANSIQVRFMQETADGGTEVRTVIIVNSPGQTIESAKDSSGYVINNSRIHYEEFKLIPYVIKLMNDGWHVDVAVIHENSYLFGYDVNLGEGYTTGQAITLPSAQIVVDYAGNGIGVKVTAGAISGLTTSDSGKTNVIIVKNEAGEEGVFQFQGWHTQNTVSSSDTLIQPSETITITEDTTLYAIWNYVEGEFVIETGTISIYKSVTLAPGSPFGSKIPTITDGGYVEFEFIMDFNLETSHLETILFDANKLDSSTGVAQTISGTLAGLINGTETYSFLTYATKTGGITVTIMLGNGESIHFLEVPIDAPSEDGDENPDTYTVAETIPQSAKKYSAAGAQEISATMSTTASAEFRFQNYYTPSVTGLEIIANYSDENESHIYILTSTTIDGFKPIRIAVPADGSVTITGLLPGTYLITEETSWNNIYSPTTDSKSITLTESGNGEIVFDYSFNGRRWLFGHSYGKKNAS